MKLYGYMQKALDEDASAPELLAEVTLCATATELRRIAEFLEFCASEMESMGAEFDHVHLSDHFKEFWESPQFVVAVAQESMGSD